MKTYIVLAETGGRLQAHRDMKPTPISATSIQRLIEITLEKNSPGDSHNLQFSYIQDKEADKWFKIWWNKKSYRIIPLKSSSGGPLLHQAQTYKIPPEILNRFYPLLHKQVKTIKGIMV